MYRRPSFLLTVLLVVTALAGGAWWAEDDLKAWLTPHLARAMQTSGIDGTACVLPTEHEQLVIIVAWRKGKLAYRCAFVGSRGTYSRPAKGGES